MAAIFYFLILQQKNALLPMKITRKGPSEPSQVKTEQTCKT
jgi:hypothetical protein